MIHYQAHELATNQQYKLLTGSVTPRPIAWITTLTKEFDLVNAAPFSFFNVVSREMPLLSLAILREDEQMKDTARNILANGELVIHIVDEPVVAAMNQTSAKLPVNQSELADLPVHLLESKTVAVPGIAEAKIRFEAKLYQHTTIKDPQEKVLTDLFIVEVTDFYFAENVLDDEKKYLLTENLQPVARLAGNQYTKVTDTFTLDRP